MKRAISFAGVTALATMAFGLGGCVNEPTEPDDEEPVDVAEQAVGFCDPNPCKNSGTCGMSGGQPVCTCPAGFTGQYCQYRDVCGGNASICKNGGTCENIVPPPAGGRPVSCTCPVGFTGWDCSISTCPCSQADPQWNEVLKTPGVKAQPFLFQDYFNNCQQPSIQVNANLLSVYVPKYSVTNAQMLTSLEFFTALMFSKGNPTYCALNLIWLTNYISLPGVVWSEYNAINLCGNGSSGIGLPVTADQSNACSKQIDAAPGGPVPGCGGSPVSGLPDIPLPIALGAPGLVGLAGLLRRRFKKSDKGAEKGARRRRWPLSLIGGLLVVALALLTGCKTSKPSSQDHEGTAASDLTAAQCAYFDVNGKDQICHWTGSAKKPYTIIKTSEAGCVNGHAGHPHDYITSPDPSSPAYDPTCNGSGCLPATAPCDATLPCCDGLVCDAGTCVSAADPCASAPCQNGGACAADGSGYTCACQEGYSGTDCEIVADPCAWGPCQNGGTCTALDALYYTCSCANGYTGFECEIPPDPCAGNPCNDHGICAPQGDSYTCTCLPGWRGNLPSCDTPSCPCADAEIYAPQTLAQPGLEVVPTGLQSLLAACAPGATADVSGFRVYIAGYDSTALADFEAAIAALDPNDSGFCGAAGALWADVLLGTSAINPTPATGYFGAGSFSGSYNGVTFSGTMCKSSLATFETNADQNAACVALIDAAGGGSPVDM